MMEFLPGVVSSTGTTLKVSAEGEGTSVPDANDASIRLPLRTKDDAPIKLTPDKRVILYGTYIKRRSVRHRRFLVHEVYEQTSLL